MLSMGKAPQPSENSAPVAEPNTSRSGQLLSVFRIFLGLGCISFGGPAAHIGYFRREFVQQRHWISESEYASLVALSQFLPGPGSSQLGFALGIKRAGLAGGLAAFLGFTLPSFLLMVLLALSTATLVSDTLFTGLTHGLKLLAVVVVADACLSMFRSFCRQALSRVLALAAFLMLLLAPVSSLIQILLLILGAFAGWAGLRQGSSDASKVTEDSGKKSASFLPLYLALLLNLGLLLAHLGLPEDTLKTSAGALFLGFFQVGSLVFGGGHVVLPLMESMMLHAVTPERFLTGYSLAQAVPGPMFTLASFLGAEIGWQNSQQLTGALLLALLTTGALFLPGLLLMAVVLPHWQRFSAQPVLMSAIQGINAVVVGFLLQALAVMLMMVWFKPLTMEGSEPFTPLLLDAALIFAGWIALKYLKLPIVGLVVAFAGAGLLMAF